MVAKLDLSPVYMSNIENDRRAAPSQEYLERMALLLQLDKPEREWMLDLAAKSKQNRVSADLPDYIMDREIVRAALRTAGEKADATDQEWQDFYRPDQLAHEIIRERTVIPRHENTILQGNRLWRDRPRSHHRL